MRVRRIVEDGLTEWPPVWSCPLDLLKLTPAERSIYDAAAFWEGLRAHQDGFFEGYQQRVAEEEAAWVSMAASIRKAGGPFAGLRFSELAELRKDHEAASLARARERLLFNREAS